MDVVLLCQLGKSGPPGNRHSCRTYYWTVTAKRLAPLLHRRSPQHRARWAPPAQCDCSAALVDKARTPRWTWSPLEG